jgi:Raf kinase inhibitor-like YbhB/YbcL family protein
VLATDVPAAVLRRSAPLAAPMDRPQAGAELVDDRLDDGRSFDGHGRDRTRHPAARVDAVETVVLGATLTGVSEFALTSEAFTQRGQIPRRYTCEGVDVSPALSWSDPPPGARTLALVVDDPDAPIGTFTHWLAWNIDPSAGGLAEGESAPAEGRNDFGAGGWSGPCPPREHGAHRYVFRLHALDATLDVALGAGRDEVEDALEGHVLATAELIGMFER